MLRAIADLRAEVNELDGIVARLEPNRWATPTPSPGWTIAHQVAHLAWTDRVAALAVRGDPRFAVLRTRLMETSDGMVDGGAEWAGLGADEILLRWRHARAELFESLAKSAAMQRVDWFGPSMSVVTLAASRLMETWAHGLDVSDALGYTRPATDRLRWIAHLGVRTRDFSFVNRGLPAPGRPFRVELVAPAGQVWSWGPDDACQSVVGSAEDFCLLVTRRRNARELDLAASGPDAERWLTIAQAFAGPPGYR